MPHQSSTTSSSSSSSTPSPSNPPSPPQPPSRKPKLLYIFSSRPLSVPPVISTTASPSTSPTDEIIPGFTTPASPNSKHVQISLESLHTAILNTSPDTPSAQPLNPQPQPLPPAEPTQRPPPPTPSPPPPRRSFTKSRKRLSTATSYSRKSTSSTMSNFWADVVNTTAFSYLKFSIAASTGVAALLSTALYFKQNDLIYPRHFPPEARTELWDPSKFHMTNWDKIDLETPDGETLRSFFLRGQGVQRKGVTILMFHGNAGNVGHRIPIAKVFAEQMGCNVFMLGYRGYGLSTGKPDEKGLKVDAETALDWIFKNDETKGTKVVVYGQSLGGALGIATAAKHQDQLSGLILENTFTSMRDVIPNVFPPAKYVTRLCHQVWPSEDIIPKINKIPVLFLSGLQDELVPPSHMKRLHAISKAPIKVWRDFPNGTHNDSVMEAGYFENINDFINDEVTRHKKAQ
ncbi:uncharacterized protein DFL_008931 [Arthrobotrys flagrans]|uniref:AB hydrolase-1 domain-containing protein n=1 Tax=Arthrobotrys flagrans TaxID=97331 RepID=A0A436ZQD4_ARTFL|nr:hypothetical protein DFL_008931 [Arthrobotrys flagrans]